MYGNSPNYLIGQSLFGNHLGIHERYIKKMLLINAAFCVVLGLLFSYIYYQEQRTYLLALHIVVLLNGFFSLYAALASRLRFGAFVCSHAAIFFVVISCLFDTPMAHLPRSTHMFLITLSIGFFVAFYRYKFYLRIILPLVSLVFYIIFAVSSVGFMDPEILPPKHTRELALWLNNVCAVTAIGVILLAVMSKIDLRRRVELDILAALRTNQFYLVYQPQYREVRTLTGFEALIRWQHPTKGNIPPSQFIPLAEETGIISDIGEWTMKEIKIQSDKWHLAGLSSDIRLSLNVSARQIDQENFVPRTILLLDLDTTKPQNFRLEITENVLSTDLNQTALKMCELSEKGVSWSLDDFGTGQSSFSLLRKLPFQEIKIDRSFVSELPGNNRDVQIVKSILSAGGGLGIDVIAEGIETEEQLRALSHLGCHNFQGYLFGKPMAADHATALLIERENQRVSE